MSQNMTTMMENKVSTPSLVAPVNPTPVAVPASSRPLISWPALWVVLLALSGFTATIAFLFYHLDATPNRGFFTLILTLLLGILAAWFDAASGRIPNPLTYPAILIGLFLALLTTTFKLVDWAAPSAWLNAPDITNSLLGLLLGGGLGLACLICAGLGGGDLKLLAAFGALLGFRLVGNTMVWALILAVPYALVNLVLVGKLNNFCRLAAAQLLTIVYLHQSIGPVESTSKRTIPLAIPLLLGLFPALAYPNALGL